VNAAAQLWSGSHYHESGESRDEVSRLRAAAAAGSAQRVGEGAIIEADGVWASSMPRRHACEHAAGRMRTAVRRFGVPRRVAKAVPETKLSHHSPVRPTALGASCVPAAASLQGPRPTLAKCCRSRCDNAPGAGGRSANGAHQLTQAGVSKLSSRTTNDLRTRGEVSITCPS